MELSKFREKATSRFRQQAVVEAAISLAERIGAFAAEDELEDADYIDELSEVILSVAPHKALIEAFQDFSDKAAAGTSTIDDLSDLFDKTRVAELASYAQIAAERVKGIRGLERLLGVGCSSERDLQKLITDAPWLIHPTWTVITTNHSLKTFKLQFERFWKDRTGEDVTLAITHETKQPDFVLISIGGTLHIVEIKAVGHAFNTADFERLHNYVEAFKDFADQNQTLMAEYVGGWQIDLVADEVKLTKVNKTAFEALEKGKVVVRRSWTDFLHRAKRTHEQFLEVRDAADAAAAGDA